ncbi:MAG: hypothetical protein HUU21_06130 [Polyangiaceae bacterium]|nr:hypothetical protein [Polyangiaceae bacterium]NUQ73114.1 hypothetical protein [Polyangiaceae bacterium]
MGRATGNPRRTPPPPQAQPTGGAGAGSGESCVECNKCKNGTRRGIQDYACWCGGDNAPARNLESQIPANEADWDQWVKDNNLPQPYDAVDRCCMIHDLELGQARQQDPSLSFSSRNPRIAAINSRLSKCFWKQAWNFKNSAVARGFALDGATFFKGLSWYNGIGSGAGATGAMSTTGISHGFGGVGAGSSSLGATHTLFP